MFYTYKNNCVANNYLVFEASSQSASDTKALALGVLVGAGHQQWTKKDLDKTSPTVEGTIIAKKVGTSWVNLGSGVNGQVVFNNGSIISY